MTQNTSQLEEIKELMSKLSGGENATPQAPPKGIAAWIGNAQKACHPKLNQVRVSLFFAHHGFAGKLKITDLNFDKYVKDNIEGTGKLNRLCQAANTDLRLYEMDTDTPTADCLSEDSPAMETDDMVKAMAYGMISVEPGLELITATAFGHGSEASARALLAAHMDGNADDTTATRLLKVNNGRKGFDALQQIGGYELAALCGLVIAARLANVPVLLEGETGTAILSILAHENIGIIDHCALTGWSEIKTAYDTPYYAPPHAVAKEPGLALMSLIPVIKNLVILEGA